MFNIKQWCAHQDPRDYLSTPFNFNEYTIACNGHAIVATPKEDGHPYIKESLRENIEKLLNANGLEFEKLPADIKLTETSICKKCRGSTRINIEQCNECGGEGEIVFENDHNTYDCECKGCGGDGTIVNPGTGGICDECCGFGDAYDRFATVVISNVTIYSKYARLLFLLDKLEVSGNDNKLHFRSGDITGVILGHRN
jgi:DnaJ-class molecular chaperone